MVGFGLVELHHVSVCVFDFLIKTKNKLYFLRHCDNKIDVMYCSFLYYSLVWARSDKITGDSSSMPCLFFLFYLNKTHILTNKIWHFCKSKQQKYLYISTTETPGWMGLKCVMENLTEIRTPFKMSLKYWKKRVHPLKCIII